MPYVVIFAALAIFTAVSFLVNSAERADGLFGRELIGPGTGFTIILGVAIVKAVLVATFFMHLKVDWSRFYFIIIPVMILGTILVVVLLPDIVLAWHH
jgi:cytochrome c oxidase subunit IV